MHPCRKPPIFIDLDETLIYASECCLKRARFACLTTMGFHVYRRPEAAEVLQYCQRGGRKVYLFTHSSFGYAAEICRILEFPITVEEIFSYGMIMNCREGLAPNAVLIENKPPDHEDTQIKMKALGIGPSQVWVIPSFEPPSFPSAKLFLAGLDWRLAKLDQGG